MAACVIHSGQTLFLFVEWKSTNYERAGTRSTHSDRYYWQFDDGTDIVMGCVIKVEIQGDSWVKIAERVGNSHSF